MRDADDLAGLIGFTAVTGELLLPGEPVARSVDRGLHEPDRQRRLRQDLTGPPDGLLLDLGGEFKYYKLKLWHGVDSSALAVMGLSLLTLAGGWALYRVLRWRFGARVNLTPPERSFLGK